jgi:acetamidase/formamidase
MDAHAAVTLIEDTHNRFDRGLAPVATVEPGEVVRFRCPGPPLPPVASVTDLGAIDFQNPHVITGPVAVPGAQAGDALAIDIVDLRLSQPFGHTIVAPGVGLLPDDFEAPYVHSFAFEGDHTMLTEGVRITLEPFLGIMGLAPAAPGSHPTIPPRRVGGNLDIRDLTIGSRLLLPIEVDGALFSCGDGHAAQGDGEVCVTAIETELEADLRFEVISGLDLPAPRFVTAPRRVARGTAGWMGASAVGDDLLECARDALRALIAQLVAERGLTRQEAYVLCSIAADLRINEVVNAPNWVVSAQLPLEVFTAG